MTIKKTRCSGTKTEAAFWGWIRSVLRRTSIKWKPRSDFLKENRKPYNGTNKRTKWIYRCFGCNNYFKLKEIEVDHIIPCGPLRGPEDLAGFIERLFCEKDGYQILCKQCHRDKTHAK